MRKPLVVANWKMNGDLQTNKEWFLQMAAHMSSITSPLDIVVAPSFVHLAQAQEHLTGTRIHLGMQDVSAYTSGAFTGQISAAMGKEFNVTYVIIGHSERRSLNSENDQLIAKKVKQAINSELNVILCVGETKEERDNKRTKDVVARQLVTVLDECVNENLGRLVIAYEPIWAIGTGQVATPEQAQEVHGFLRGQIAQYVSIEIAKTTRILYGGSVNASNAHELFSQLDIDGGLVGGASLTADSFMRICLAAEKVERFDN